MRQAHSGRWEELLRRLGSSSPSLPIEAPEKSEDETNYPSNT